MMRMGCVMPALLIKMSTAAKILDYLLRHAFALIFFSHVTHVTTMGVSDGGCDPLRFLPFKVQERHGSPMFRKKLRSGQSDTLLRRRT